MTVKVWYYLDDERTPRRRAGVKWVVYRDPRKMLSDIRNHGLPDGISFDHDLGEDTMSGYDAAMAIVDMVLDGDIEPKATFEWNVHSANPVGAKRIALAMRDLERVMAAKL